MEDINVKLSWKYRADLDFLKQVVTNKNNEAVKDDSELVEILIAWFTSMLEEEANNNENDDEEEANNDACGCWHSH